MVTRTEAIKNFLKAMTHPDLAEMYSHDMECQVNVVQGTGERVGGEFKGRKWHGYSDGIQTWKSFRIPYNANTEPNYDDKEIKFDLAVHADGIGMTGWDWSNRCSKWLAYDFDAIAGHSEGLQYSELLEIEKVAIEIPWITARHSTSGHGLHLYVFLNNVPTKNHNEHAALARAILSKMSSIAGYNFENKVDICGGNMWIWHRKMKGTNGLELIKQGSVLEEIPKNWKDHIKVITGRRRRTMPNFVQSEKSADARLFEEISGQRSKTDLDEDHLKLIKWLEERKTQSWWDSDHNMLVTHTFHLKEAHTALEFRGIFDTVAKGTEAGADHNSFMFPMRNGAWAVRRYTIGVTEHETWDQDTHGYTRCYFNKEPDLATASRAYEGTEHPSGGYIYRHADDAVKAAQSLGVDLGLPNWAMGKKTKLKAHKDGRLIAEVERDAQSDVPQDMKGWIAEGKSWKKIFNIQVSGTREPEVGNYDDITRHLVTESGDDYGWVIKSTNKWINEPLAHVKVALEATGATPKEVKLILGQSIFQHWKLVNKPFQPEYPGDRQWNRNAAQLKFLPTEDRENLKYPTWLKILEHCGSGLDATIKENGWAKANGILTGADYLKCWLASLFQKPREPLPYIFFYGPQNSGKSIFHESINLLLTKGVERADLALTSQQGFSGELENAILCVVEETDLRKNRVAYNRIKDWVTAPQLVIHKKGQTPYHIPNTTHWVQCGNDSNECPVFPGDTRITLGYVDLLDPLEMIPKRKIIPLLEKEAPDFLAEIIKLEIPESNDRLNVPVIATEEKKAIEKANQTMLEMYLDENCYCVQGERIKFSELYDKFQEWLEPNEVHNWSKIRVGRELPPRHPKGRLPQTGEHWIGNIAWEPSQSKEPRLILVDGKLMNEDG